MASRQRIEGPRKKSTRVERPGVGVPSQVVDRYWLEAQRKSRKYPKHTEHGGKWLIFVPTSGIDSGWRTIKLAVEDGRLGESAKVSTAKPNPNSTDPMKHVICVYTYDANDIEDVKRIRQQLRELGVIQKIPYKTDDATFAGRYEKTGHKRISSLYE